MAATPVSEPMVLSRLFRKSAIVDTPAPPKLPAGERVYAIGDVHGRLDCLDKLWSLIAQDRRTHASTTCHTSILFLGDLIDRGPDSRGVIERVRTYKAADPDVHVIMGNHEEILLAAAEGDRQALSVFTRVGGRETLLSYGASASDYDDWDLRDICRFINAAIPIADLDFIRDFETSIAIGDYRFVHAGVRPGVAFDQQRTGDLRWIRGRFLECDAPLDGFVIHGHSVSLAPDERCNRIGIDTGAYDTGRLTAIVLEGEDRRYLTTQI